MEKQLSFKKITCVKQEQQNGKYHFVFKIDWKPATLKKDKKIQTEIEYWGIPGNALVSEKYNKYIEEIIYCINHRMIEGCQLPKQTFFYPLRYMTKTLPADVEKNIRNWYKTDQFIDNERFMIKEVPVDRKSFIVYDQLKNQTIPIGLFDYMFDQDRSAMFKTFFDASFPKNAQISTYFLVNQNALKLDWHITTFVDSFYKRYPLLEDIGCWPEHLKELHKIFSFTCPVSTDKYTPSGEAQMPKPFYNQNKNKFMNLKYFGLNIEISDPHCEIFNYDLVQEVFGYICDKENPLTISFVRYNKVATSEILNKGKYEYSDYVNMAKQLGDNFVMPWEINSERELKSLHDNILKEFNLHKYLSKQELKNKYLEIKENYPKYEYSDNRFLIKYPDDIDDLSIEGCTLHHCVGSYKNKVMDQSAIILFLRTCDDCDHPFVTLHLINKGDHYDLVQAHGICNCSIKTIDGVFEFVKDWCEKFNIEMENIDRTI